MSHAVENEGPVGNGDTVTWIGRLITDTVNARDQDNHGARGVLRMAGLWGFLLGMATGWQVAVESAQVVAGVVQYPAGNPFYLYHMKTWTLLHQLPALGLKLGLSERVLALGISGLIGMLSFQGIALVAYALCRNRFLSCLIPPVALATNACKEITGIYPVRILSNQPWVVYGAFGTSYCLTVWMLYALGFRRRAWFFMGLAPCVHPAMGSWCLAVGTLGMVWQTWAADRAAVWSWSYWRPCVTYMGAGMLATCCSLAAHWNLTRGLPTIDPATAQKFIDAFADGWDSHRKPFPWESPLLGIGACTVALGWLWTTRLGGLLTESGRNVLRQLMLAGAAGLSLALLTRLHDWLPTALMMAMPGRYINVTALAFPAVIVALCHVMRGWLPMRAVLLGLSVYFALRTWLLAGGSLYVPTAARVLLVTGLLILGFAPAFAAWHQSRAVNSKANGGVFGGVCLDVPARISWAAALLLAVYIAWLYPHDTKFAVALMPAALAVLAVNIPAVARWVLRRNTEMRFAAAASLLTACVLLGVALIPAKPVVIAVLVAAVASMAVLAASATLHPVFKHFGLFAAAAAGLACTVLWFNQCHARLKDWHNDAVYQGAHQGSGVLLTASRMRAIQMHTRRPILLEGAALNQLPYVPESGPEMNRILRGVYGEDLFRPRPAWWQADGGLDVNTGKELWLARSQADWQQLAREFGFTQVLCFADWKLDLPAVATNGRHTLYNVPGLTLQGPVTGTQTARATTAGEDQKR